MDNQSYVYVYLDPTAPGKYEYAGYSFDFKPFYVGEGIKYRYTRHLKETHSKYKNHHKINKIEQLRKKDLAPIIIKLKSDMSKSGAQELEKELINTIGRRDIGAGPLLNMTDGGDGTIGCKLSTGKKVSQYDLTGKLIKTYDSMYEASKMTGCANISMCCHGNRAQSGGFIFRFSGKKIKDNIDVSFLKDKMHLGPKPVKIYQYNNKGILIAEFNSIKEASISTGCLDSKIVSVAKGKRKQTLGFIWSYNKKNES